MKTWKKKNIIRDEHYKEMQKKVDKCTVPSSIGKIPLKIESSFDGFTSDEFKNWTLIFSLYALHGLMEKVHIDCWRLFVLACVRICRKRITTADIAVFDSLMLRFCKTFEELYGSENTTPNMHLHLHMKECLEDFGPVYGFWLFSFERYNGILGKTNTNKRSVEFQIVEHFLREHYHANIPTRGD